MSRFLRFVCILTGIIFVGNAFAAGYVCEDLRTYTSCGTGYYMTTSNNTSNFDANGSWCIPCSEADGVDTYCPGGIESPIYKLTLDQNGATTNATVTTLWFQSNPRRFCTDKTNCAGTVVAQLTGARLPTKTGYKFLSYSNDANPGDGDMYISDTGMIDEFGDVDVDYILRYPTWYAQWKKINPSESGCPAGQYVSADGTECLACPAGSYQPNDGNTATSCTPCGDGKWSAQGAKSCQTITAGCYGTSADRACPSVCGADSYSNAGAASCTPCITANGYRNKADNIAANHAGVSSCKVTCSAGTAVIKPNERCVTPTVPGWFTDKSQTVAYGDLSTMNFCPNAFDDGSQHDTQCGACSASDIGAGKTFSPHTTARYLRIKSVSASGVDIGLVEIKPYFLEAESGIYYPIPVGLYDGGMSGVSGNPEVVVDGKYLPEHFSSGVSSGSIASLPAKDSTFTVMVLGGSPVEISAIDVTFFGIASMGIVYEIEVSIDGTNWQSIYSNSNGVETPNAMFSSSVPSGKLVTRRFIAYGESESASGQYASNRDVMLCVGGDGLTSTPCPTTYPNSVAGSDEKTDCYIDCLKTIPNGELQADRDKSYFGGTMCGYTVTCNPGYSGSTGPDLVTLTPKCTPKCVRVVLQQTLEGHSPLFIFSKYNDKNSWYSDDSCTTQISEITKPVADGWEFGGYWSAKGEDANMQIEADATLPVAAGFERVPYDSTTIKVTPGNYTTEQTWYARWVKKCESTASALCLGPYYDASTYKVHYVNCCLPGYNKTDWGISINGTTCPTGT